MIDSIADWLLAYWTHGLVLGGLALVIVRAAVRRPAMRTLLWRVALFAPPLTATLALWTSDAASSRALSITAPLRLLIRPARIGQDVEVRVVQLVGSRPQRSVTVSDPFARGVALVICGLAFSGGLGGALGLV